MLLIKKPNEINLHNTFIGLIYGVPGGGKTTLSLSAPDALLIDLDDGAHRVDVAHLRDVLPAKKWEEIKATLSEDLSAYKTLVFDTAGKLIEIMAEYVMQEDARQRQSDGTLTVKGWGVVKVMFKNLIKECKALNKHIIFIAHEKEEKENDLRLLRPDIAGSAKNDLLKELDFMGYLEKVGEKRLLHLAPSGKIYAKNSLGITNWVEVPNVDINNDFLTREIFERTINNKRERAKQHAEYLKLCGSLNKSLSEKTPNEFLDILSKTTHIWDSKIKFWGPLEAKAKKEGLFFDNKTKKFVKEVKNG